MNDEQRAKRLIAARTHFKMTKQGYHPTGPHWKSGMAELNFVIRDLLPEPVPSLGKLYASGRSVLLEDLTHATTNIEFYPALDTAFKSGTKILAVEDMEVIRASSSSPGDAFYARGVSKLKYWYGHLVLAPAVGRKFKKGDVVGVVCKQTRDGKDVSHAHWAINIEDLFGKRKQLLYGATGHGPNYTHGSPTIGKQLRDLLAA